MTRTLNLFEGSELKRMLKEKFRMELHFDNEYSAQAFHFDSVPSPCFARWTDISAKSGSALRSVRTA